MSNYEITQKIDRGFARKSINTPSLADLPESLENQPVNMRQFASFVTDFHELSARFYAYDNALDELVKRQIQHMNRLDALDSAVAGLRDELDEQDSRIDRYVFSLLVVIGLVLWAA